MEEVLHVQEGRGLHHHHDQQSLQQQEQQRHRREQRLRYIELRRLLYCMQHHEGLPVNEDEGTGSNNGDSNSFSAVGRQSWQSLLFRAQLCQDLWHQVAHEWSTTDRGRDEDDDNDPDGRREYNDLSREVDMACRRAHELAEQARLEQQQQRQQRQQRQQVAFTGNTADSKNYSGDLIQRLFLSPMNDPSFDRNVDDDNEGDGTDDMNDEYEEGEEEEDGSYETEEGEDSQEPNHHTPSHSKQPGHNFDHHHRRANNEVSTADLQESQREQMEEAISQMARQMKEATQHIQGRIQQQTGTTLNELEAVAEENVNDVTQVAKDVSEHNSDTNKSTWATWTVLVALVGVFCFSLITVFTIPKSPSACLFFCGNNNQSSWPVRLLAKTTEKVGTVFGSMLDQIVTTVEQISNGDFPAEDIPSEDGSDSWSHIYDEDEELRREKERLNRLLQSMNDPSGDSGSGEDAGNDAENPWGTNSVDDDEETGRRKERRPNEALVNEDGSIDIQQQDQNGEDIPDVDVDEILASLKKRMDEQQAENEHKQLLEDESSGMTDPPTGASSEGGSAADSFDRGGMTRERFAPKDVRVAAASDDYDTLHRYLSSSAEHINRQDKFGWTPLHFAVSNGHKRIVDLLLSYGSDPYVETKTGQTVLDLAIEKLERNSPISRAIMKAMGHDVNEDVDVPETMKKESEDGAFGDDFPREDDAHGREVEEADEHRRLEAEEAERRRLQDDRIKEEEERRRLVTEEEERKQIEEEEQARQEEEEKQRRFEAEEVEQRRLEEEERARQQQDEERRRFEAEEAEQRHLEEEERARQQDEEEQRRRVEAEEAEQRRVEEEDRARQQDEDEHRRRVEAEEAEQRRLAEDRLEEQQIATEEEYEDKEAHDAKRKKIFTPPPLEDEDDDQVHHHDVGSTEMNQWDEL